MTRNRLLVLPFVIACMASLQPLNSQINDQRLGTVVSSGLRFTENKGQVSDQFHQARPDVLFSGEMPGVVFHIRKGGISYQMTRVDSWKVVENGMKRDETNTVPDRISIHRTDINWIGTNEDFRIETAGTLPGYSNYYLPVCPDGVFNVKSYGEVRFNSLYSGIDIRWYEDGGRLEYDYVIAPNAESSTIRWRIAGAENVYVSDVGELVIQSPFGEMHEAAPVAFQGKQNVPVKWSVENGVVGFEVGTYDHSEVLVIDPVVRLWGTFYGGSDDDEIRSCATDAGDNLFIAGSSSSTNNIATTGSQQSGFNSCVDAFVAKFTPAGVRQWATYYGGSVNDLAFGCVADANNNIFLAGWTDSKDVIATAGSHQPTYGGNLDGFLVKFNSFGIRLWGTYFGGSSYEYLNSCAIDAASNIYVCGETNSGNAIATSGAHQTSRNGGIYEGFLAKFSNSGSLIWGTYYGGGGDDKVQRCAVDGASNVYICGQTNSTSNISTSGGHQTAMNGTSDRDAFLVKFNSSGVRQWATYYGGDGDEEGSGCATDASMNVYLAGFTDSYNAIATPNSFKSANSVDNDAFLVKFNSNGTRQWGTYYGGNKDSGFDVGDAVTTDTYGNVYLVGSTNSTTDIATNDVYKTVFTGSPDIFIAKFSTNGNRIWATYSGGTGADNYPECVIDSKGRIYLTAMTWSTGGISTTGCHQPNSGGRTDGFAICLSQCYLNNTLTLSGGMLTSNEAAVSYQWLDCNDSKKPIAGANQQSFNSGGSGSYAVALTSLDCKDTSDCFDVSVSGLTETANSDIWFVYPNPFQNILNIRYDKSTQFRVFIYDVNGRELVTTSIGSGQRSVDLSFLQPGIYVLKALSGEDIRFKRIVKK